MNSRQLQHGGYRVGNLRDLDVRFLCTHCHYVLREPMQGDCGHRYCRSCVQAKYAEARLRHEDPTCPACDAGELTEISPDRTYPDTAINREMNKQLTVQCPNAPCDRTMLLKELEKHQADECDFKPKQCDLCGQTLPAAELEGHKNNQCPKRTVKCDVCKESVLYELVADHKSSTCVGSTELCEYCCARVKADDQAIDNHRRSECPVGWHRDNPCPYGCVAMSEPWDQHRLKCLSTHLDRLRAGCLLGMSADQAQSWGEDRMKTAAADSTSSRDVATAGPGLPRYVPRELAVIGDLDYELVGSLLVQAKSVERSLQEIAQRALEQFKATDDSQSQAVTQLNRLQLALSQGDKLRELLASVRNQLDQNIERMRRCEQQMQKSSEAKHSIERRQLELTKLLVYKEMKIVDLERRIDIMELAGYEGTLVWKIANIKQRREDAREGRANFFHSPPFYTSKYGYKMCGRLYLNGEGAGKNTHVSLFFALMRGPFDALLPWPFVRKVTVTLLDQNFQDRHVVEIIKPDTASPSFKKPTNEVSPAIGFPQFIPLTDLDSGARGYVKDDAMLVKFVVDKTDIP